MKLPEGKFPAILADPPWRFNSLWGGRPKKTDAGYASRAVEAHYDTMTIDDPGLTSFECSETALLTHKALWRSELASMTSLPAAPPAQLSLFG